MQEKKERYIYPAVLDFADDGITIDFPDLPGCMPCAENIEQALHNAREALGLHLFNMENDGEIIPKPTDILKIAHEKNQAVILVDVFMPTVRYAVENKAIKKTLSVPQWLDVLAREYDINFSQVLQDALMEKLKISRKKNLRK